MNWRLRQAMEPFYIQKGVASEYIVARDPSSLPNPEKAKITIPPHPDIEYIEVGGVRLRHSGSYADIFPTMSKLMPIGKGPGWIIHTGACKGVESAILYKLFWRNMICVEADYRNKDELCARMHDLTQSHPFEVKVLPMAVGNFNGRAQFHLSNTDDGPWTESSSLKQPKEHLAQSPELNWKTSVEVAVFKLDTMWENMGKPEVFLWHGDLEGGEREAFEGAQEMLKNTRYVFCEFSHSERYEGAMNAQETFAMLPGQWKFLAWWQHGFFADGLFIREDA